VSTPFPQLGEDRVGRFLRLERDEEQREARAEDEENADPEDENDADVHIESLIADC
jgi:hypothetical protein